MKDRYPGTIGKTHGDANERRPKTKAENMFMLSIRILFLPKVQGFRSKSQARLRRAARTTNTDLSSEVAEGNSLAHDPDLDFSHDIRKQSHVDSIDAKGFDRFFKFDHTLVDTETFLLE